jgi:diguanylate cyclase (GGDEF)-like protein
MRHAFLLIITDGLEKHSLLFDSLKKTAPYKLEVASFSELCSGKYDLLFNAYYISEIIIGINIDFFTKIKSDLLSYLNKKHGEIFQYYNNFLYLYPDFSFVNELDFQRGKKFCFDFFDGIDQQIQSAYFHMYLVILFDKLISTSRLETYIQDSFQETVSIELLKKKNNEIERLNDELEKINKIDSLTNLYNRRALLSFLDNERKRANRELWRLKDRRFPNKPQGDLFEHFGVFSVLMIDLDHFKSVNDTYGHLAGNKVLKALGDMILNGGIFRSTDIAGRFGGEEFIVILSDTNAEHTLEPARRLADGFKQLDFEGANNEKFHVTISIGISEYQKTDTNSDDIIRRADMALYYAKEHGRDQIIIYEKVF